MNFFFLDHYLNYAESNEAPRVYHQWAGLSAISHLIGSRVWTHMGGRLTFFPNMYVILVGEAGLKKTTAMIQARDLVGTIEEIHQAPAATSVQAITELMGKKDSPCIRSYSVDKINNIAYTQLSIFASEIMTLLNSAGQPLAVIEFLTDIWDRCGGSFREGYKSSGNKEIMKPYITILACNTPEHMKALISQKIVGSGMSRRCLFIYALENGEPHPFIETTPEQDDSWGKCIHHAKVLQNTVGAFSWTPEAKKIYDAWYMDFQPKVKVVESQILKTFYMSKPEYIIKVSMLLALCANPPLLIHTEETFVKALEMISSVETGACQLFEGHGRNELALVSEDVYKYLLAKGKVAYKTCQGRFWKDLKAADANKEFTAIIDQLVTVGRIEILNSLEGQFLQVKKTQNGEVSAGH